MESKANKNKVNDFDNPDFADIKAPADFTSPEELYQQLVKVVESYHPSADISMIEKAYHIADSAHKEQCRRAIYYTSLMCSYHIGRTRT